MSHHELSLPAKVLLVDDEEEYVRTLAERLERRAISTVVVLSGDHALQIIGQEQPDVMILDLRMPGTDGMEVLRRVKKARMPVEVIILTGHGSKKDQALAMELGAFAYLEKPADIHRLISVLREANEKINRDKQRKEAADS